MLEEAIHKETPWLVASPEKLPEKMLGEAANHWALQEFKAPHPQEPEPSERHPLKEPETAQTICSQDLSTGQSKISWSLVNEAHGNQKEETPSSVSLNVLS